jgi:alpha-amylase/alpha-mannosidase (GH57 family)
MNTHPGTARAAARRESIMQRYLCIHGHFYQPPRENPWLEAVELQDSAHPYHDWNERITAECYAPNATARMLDAEGRIIDIVNNYSRISFNFGPTLLAWMEQRAPDVLNAIIEADRQSRQRFSGHGSALAQIYNHMIMPLASLRDKHTQVLWGLRDFQHRFGRSPEGMWLSETAADTASLEVLAQHGIRFTLLSPFQASRVRSIRGGPWTDVNGGQVDPSRPYLVRLPGGRSIAVFFYDAPVSKAVAFERLLSSGEAFAHRLMDAYDDLRTWDQLVHIATDGESYGHHHRYGEMALAYALHFIESNHLARLTNYGEFLAQHPPSFEVQIHEKSAWSCQHGVARWYADCGCNSGRRPGWNQRWRAPLREALDWLRDALAPRFESMAARLLRDPWAARDDYISVILDRSDASLSAFFEHHASRPLQETDQVTVLRLLEMQRHAMLMYTSCGWFFDELSGIETVQVMQYAGRAIQILQNLGGEDLEPAFVDRLGRAPTNIPEHRNGRHIYDKFVKPAIIDREKLGAHFAVSSLFEEYPERFRVYSCTFEQQHKQVFTAGKARLIVGSSKVTFDVTRASDVLTYAALHLGDHNVNGGVRFYRGQEAFQELVNDMSESFNQADFPKVIRLMDRHFGESYYSLKSLFRDEQRKILAQILVSTRQDVESHFRQITDQHTPLMRFLRDIDAPLPAELRTAADFVLNRDLQSLFQSQDPDPARVRELVEQARNGNVELQSEVLAYVIKGNFDQRLVHLADNPADVALLARTADLAEVVRSMDLDLNLWKTENVYFHMRREIMPGRRTLADAGDQMAQEWMWHFNRLGDQLGFRVQD